MAVAMLLPLLVLEVLGRNHVGSNAAVGTLLGVLFVAFCDLGPSLRIRAWAMAAGATLGALLMELGSAIGGSWWVVVPTLALATFLSGVLSVYGPVVAQVGVILTIVFAVALGRDGGPASAVPAALGFIFGGTFFPLLVFVSFLPGMLPHPIGQASKAARVPLPPTVPRPGSIRRSSLVRFAALRATGVALIAGLAWGAGIPYPQWAPVVVIGSVRPNQMAALRLTTQRVIGTILGAGLADLVLAWVHDPSVLAGLAVGGVFMAFTVKDVNHTFFIFFLTVLTLLLVNIPAPGPTHAALRVVTTLIGAAAALGVSWLSAWIEEHSSAAASPPESPPGSAVAQ